VKNGLYHVKDKPLIYYLTESLFKIVHWLNISIVFKSCN